MLPPASVPREAEKTLKTKNPHDACVRVARIAEGPLFTKLIFACRKELSEAELFAR